MAADRGVTDADAALEGARAILVERFAEDADVVGELRERLWRRGRLVSRVVAGQQEAGAKFADWFEHAEPLRTLPSHRILAMFRGEKEGALALAIEDPDEADAEPAARGPYEQRIAERFGIADRARRADRWLLDAVRWAWRTRIAARLDLDLRGRLR